MADIAGSLMRGYSFVDNLQRQHAADARQIVEQGQRDALFQQSQDAYQKSLKDESDTTAGLRQWTAQTLGQELPDQGITKLNHLVDNPETAKKIVMDHDQIQSAIGSGKMPSSKELLQFGNTAWKQELDARGAKNGVKMELTGIHPAPGSKGVFFEVTVTKPDGTTYKAPLTEGGGLADDPNSGDHKVQEFSVPDLLHHAATTADASMMSLHYLAQSSPQNAALAVKMIQEIQQNKAKIAAEDKKLVTEHGYKMSEIGEQGRQRKDEIKMQGDNSLAGIRLQGENQKEVAQIGADSRKAIKEMGYEEVQNADGTTSMRKVGGTGSASKDKITALDKLQEITKNGINDQNLGVANQLAGIAGLPPFVKKVTPEVKGESHWFSPNVKEVPETTEYVPQSGIAGSPPNIPSTIARPGIPGQATPSPTANNIDFNQFSNKKPANQGDAKTIQETNKVWLNSTSGQGSQPPPQPAQEIPAVQEQKATPWYLQTFNPGRGIANAGSVAGGALSSIAKSLPEIPGVAKDIAMTQLATFLKQANSAADAAEKAVIWYRSQGGMTPEKEAMIRESFAGMKD